MPREVDPLLYRSFEMRPRKADLTKIRIVEAAIRCISRKGMEGGTFDQIARTLGVRRSLIAYHFKDRLDLLEAANRYITQIAQGMTIAAVQLATSPLDRARAISDSAFAWADAYPEHCRVLMLFYFYASHKPRYRRINTEIRETGRVRLAAMLRAIPGNESAPAPWFESTAKAIQSLISGLVWDHVTMEQARAGLDYAGISRELVARLAVFSAAA